jgi:hypothetical protein
MAQKTTQCPPNATSSSPNPGPETSVPETPERRRKSRRWFRRQWKQSGCDQHGSKKGKVRKGKVVFTDRCPRRVIKALLGVEAGKQPDPFDEVDEFLKKPKAALAKRHRKKNQIGTSHPLKAD